jgi:hypothetical protein
MTTTENHLMSRTDKVLIGSLLPNGYEEIVYEHADYFACYCKHLNCEYMDNKDGDDGTWEAFCEKVINEFGDNLLEIYSITSQGVYFVIYLKK